MKATSLLSFLSLLLLLFSLTFNSCYFGLHVLKLVEQVVRPSRCAGVWWPFAQSAESVFLYCMENTEGSQEGFMFVLSWLSMFTINLVEGIYQQQPKGQRWNCSVVIAWNHFPKVKWKPGNIYSSVMRLAITTRNFNIMLCQCHLLSLLCNLLEALLFVLLLIWIRSWTPLNLSRASLLKH